MQPKREAWSQSPATGFEDAEPASIQNLGVLAPSGHHSSRDRPLCSRGLEPTYSGSNRCLSSTPVLGRCLVGPYLPIALVVCVAVREIRFQKARRSTLDRSQRRLDPEPFDRRDTLCRASRLRLPDYW